VLLQRELGSINHKRAYRLYQLEELKLRRRRRYLLPELATGEFEELALWPERAVEIWSTR
jgi:hypothetical protein